MNGSVAFRVDSSRQIGSGHLMRCLTLARELRTRGLDCSFICRVQEHDFSELATQAGFPLHLLHGRTTRPELDQHSYDSWLGVSWEHDAEQTIAVLREQGIPNWLVVDHYGLGAEWEATVADSGLSVMVIDDIANRRHQAALLLDQNYFPAAEERYRPLVNQDCTLLLGPDYALLREEFRSYRTIRERNGAIDRLLLFFGGADLPNVTGKALRAIGHLQGSGQCRFSDIAVVIGSANAHVEQLSAEVRAVQGARLLTQVADMATLMQEADLSIGGGGTTTWERAWLALPSITVLLADNQRPMTEAVADSGATINLGWHETVTSAQIASTILELARKPNRVRSLSHAAARLFGDRSRAGVERVADRLTIRHAPPMRPTPIVGVGEEIP